MGAGHYFGEVTSLEFRSGAHIEYIKGTPIPIAHIFLVDLRVDPSNSVGLRNPPRRLPGDLKTLVGRFGAIRGVRRQINLDRSCGFITEALAPVF